MDKFEHLCKLIGYLVDIFRGQSFSFFCEFPETVVRTILIDDILLILLVDDFLDTDDVVSSLMFFLFGHFIDLHKDLMLPLLTDGIPAFLILIYVLLAGFNGPGFGLNVAAFAPFDRLSSADLTKTTFAEAGPMIDDVESIGVSFEDTDTIFLSNELFEVIVDHLTLTICYFSSLS